MGAALHEHAVVDPRTATFVNHDLAEYHALSRIDIRAIAPYFRQEFDDKANAPKIKGVGKLGIGGAGAAIANAVYNACSVRIRNFPLTLDNVLAGLKSTVGKGTNVRVEFKGLVFQFSDLWRTQLLRPGDTLHPCRTLCARGCTNGEPVPFTA